MGKKPNVLFILTDDQGAWALHCAGNRDIRTPNLDALAAQGMRFENFFCASPVCSPARATLLTGRMPSAHGVLDWLRGGNLDRDQLGELGELPQFASEHKAISYLEGQTAYTDVLAANGYSCALAGKWHLGDSKTPQHGFSRWFTIGRGGCTYHNGDLVENGRLWIEPRYITDVITDKALDYLDELHREDRPFYLSVHYTAPHSPWDREDHPARFWDQYEDCAFTATPDLPLHPNQIPTAPMGVGEKRALCLRGYYTAISAMDEGVGRLLKRLDELGERENTLVIFTADNGMNMGHHGVWGKGNGTFPFNMYEEAIKVPFIAVQPGQIPAGVVTGAMNSQYDFCHTLLDYLGLPGMDDPALPGHSFAPVLRGQQPPREDSVVVFDEYGFTRMIRDREWKYVHRYPYGPHELYNLVQDPGETVNRAADPACADLLRRMRARLTDWFTRYSDPRVDGSREPVTGFGQLCRPGVYARGEEVFCTEGK